MAANYPDSPSVEQQKKMDNFLRTFSEFYPCDYCALHMREEIKQRPPRVQNRQELGLWMCDLHNEVFHLINILLLLLSLFLSQLFSVAQLCNM
jgi:FAD-linked sulfhydryl oxidase